MAQQALKFFDFKTLEGRSNFDVQSSCCLNKMDSRRLLKYMEELYTKANQSYQSGNHEDAYILFKRAIQTCCMAKRKPCYEAIGNSPDGYHMHEMLRLSSEKFSELEVILKKRYQEKERKTQSMHNFTEFVMKSREEFLFPKKIEKTMNENSRNVQDLQKENERLKESCSIYKNNVVRYVKELSSEREQLKEITKNFEALKVDHELLSKENETLKKETSASNDSMTCVVCLDNQRQMVFSPCNHLVSCETCVLSIRHCPMCRSRIARSFKIYL